MSLEHRSELTPLMTADTLRDRVLKKLAARFLPAARFGQMAVTLPSGHVLTSGSPDGYGTVHVTVRRWRALWKLAVYGDNGFASAVEDGDVTTDDLLRLFDFALRNRVIVDHSLPPSKIGLLLTRLQHALRRNSQRGSRRNIAAHYDLGNDFYRPWLDRSMTYSSAIYQTDEMTLEAAQAEKIKQITTLLAAEPKNTVLEIGCGWGALMQELISQKECTVTGITLSHEQAAYARDRLRDATVAGKAKVELQDYRHCNQTYDRIVSVEMIEAVGEAYWPIYFATLRRCLAKGGRAVIQAITIAEDRFASYRREPDFIQQRVFPGGMLPTISLIEKHAADAGLDIVHQEQFGESYARTLMEWRRRFHLNWEQIQQLGFDERFRRLWDYYLAYCEAGFRHQATNVGLYVLQPK